MSLGALDVLTANVVRNDNGCILWTGPDNGVGYGRISFQGRLVYTHRLSYELAVGPIPAGMDIDHLCRTPACLRPDHLEAVTHQENIQRGIRSMRPACPYGHLFTEENTYRTKYGHRQCRVCQRRRATEARARRKAE